MEPKCLPHVTLKPNDYIPYTSHWLACQSMEQQHRMENREQHKEQPPKILAGTEAPMAPILAMLPGPCCTNKSRVPLLAPGNFLDRKSIDCRPPVGHSFVQHSQDKEELQHLHAHWRGAGLGWDPSPAQPQATPQLPVLCPSACAQGRGQDPGDNEPPSPEKPALAPGGTPQATQQSPEVLCTPKPTPRHFCSTRCWARCWCGPPAGTGCCWPDPTAQ